MYSHITSLAFQFHYIIFLPISLKYNISYLKKIIINTIIIIGV